MKKALLFFVHIAMLSACSKTEMTIVEEQVGISDVDLKVTRYLTGDAADVTTTTQAGFVLMGGSTDVDAAFEWMIERSGGGDFVVIRATGADGYNPYVYTDLGGVNSIESMVIKGKKDANDIDVYNTIVNAEALFIAGGDQWDYANYWKDTKVEDAVNYLINVKHVPVGGTSAGLAVLGDGYFDAKKGTVLSAEALSNPYGNKVSIQYNNFLDVPILTNTITDSHYNSPDRKGRHITFMARLIQDYGIDARGIGVEEETAVCIDELGIGHVYGLNNAYFLKKHGGNPETIVSGSPLTWDRGNQAIRVYKTPATAAGTNTFNLNTWTSGTGGSWWYFWAESGTLFEAAE
ncbi:MAG: cyanophycinase [Bacteroidetes bacterium]|nr:cyanophycinase [Bacteroidota bacterium]